MSSEGALEPKAAEPTKNQASERTEAAKPKFAYSEYFESLPPLLRKSIGFIGPIIFALLVAVLILWIIDKIVFYYLAQTYVDEVAKAFDLNPHLANALLILTFLVAVFFARNVWSFSKSKRTVGIAGLAVLLIGHSLLLWYGTKDQAFDDQRVATKCYVLTRDGQVTYRERPGIDPATGRECRPYTPDMFERLQKYAQGKRPSLITSTNPVFFDPRSGEAVIWYYRDKDQQIQLYDLMGFQPDTGEELLPVSKDVVAEWHKQEEQRRSRGPQLIQHPESYVFFDPQSGQPRAWYWKSPTDGHYEFFDGRGFYSQTGDKLEVATRVIVDDWKNGQNVAPTPIKPPKKIEIKDDTVFFDPVSGRPTLWYWRSDKTAYEFFDGPGFDPQNGQPLQSFTRDALSQYQKEIEEQKQELKAQQERLETDRKQKAEAEAEALAEQQRKAEVDANKRAEESRKESEAAQHCDDLAANPSDAHRVGQGTSYGDLKPQASAAVDACELGDTDSMLSLGDMIEGGQVAPQGPQELPIALYKRAADLGNTNGLRAYQTELAKAQQNEQLQAQQLQQRQIMLNVIGNVLRNVH